MQYQKFIHDGIEYELIPPDVLLRDNEKSTMTNEVTGEKRIFNSWDYEDEKPPLGWKLDEALPKDEELERQNEQNGKVFISERITKEVQDRDKQIFDSIDPEDLGIRSERVHYLADGPIPEGWGLNNSHERPQGNSRELIDEMNSLIGQFGRGTNLDKPTQKQVPPLSEDRISLNRSTIDPYYCITARQDGKMVGLLTFKLGGDGLRHGTVDRGVVKAGARKNAAAGEQPKISISEYLMRLAIVQLVSEFKCDEIETHPITKEGEKYTLNNGFAPTEVGTAVLDSRIMEKLNQAIQEQPGEELKWEGLPQIVEKIDGTVREVAKELKAEREGERADKR